MVSKMKWAKSELTATAAAQSGSAYAGPAKIDQQIGINNREINGGLSNETGVFRVNASQPAVLG